MLKLSSQEPRNKNLFSPPNFCLNRNVFASRNRVVERSVAGSISLQTRGDMGLAATGEEHRSKSMYPFLSVPCRLTFIALHGSINKCTTFLLDPFTLHF